MAGAADDNAAQRDYWNGVAGQSWSLHRADLDTLLTEVSDLLLAAAAPAAGARVLDIGCGAGASTLAFAEAVGPSGRVVGFDISEPLLGLARQRAEAEDLDTATFLHGDAARYRFDAGAADLVVSRFGLMFFADPAAALANIRTALRPGGEIVFVAWAAPDENPWFHVPFEVAVARLGPAEPTPPDAPGPMAFRDIARVVGLLAAAGFDDARGETRDVGLRVPGGIDAAAELALHVGPATRLLRDKGGDEADARAIAATLRDRLAPYATATGVRVPARINLFRAINH